MKMLEVSNIKCFNTFIISIDKNNFIGDFCHMLLKS